MSNVGVALGDSDSEQNDEASKESWALVTERSIASSVNRNVLEKVLEKDSRGSFSVSETECARFLTKVGLDTRYGNHVEGVQICPNGRWVIYITLQKDLDINKFCRYAIIDVSSSELDLY